VFTNNKGKKYRVIKIKRKKGLEGEGNGEKKPEYYCIKIHDVLKNPYVFYKSILDN